MASAHAGRSGSGTSLSIVDSLGRTVRLAAPPSRVISLVPSLTEALFALGMGERVVGITQYCVEPATQVAQVAKIGGTKTPDLPAIAALQPDLVIASAEENVREHVEALIACGGTVYVSLPHTVRHALVELRDLALLTAAADSDQGWLALAEAMLESLETRPAPRPVRYLCPIWRRPYMVAAPETYMSDLLRVCGGVNVFDGGPARYYPVELSEAVARRPELVFLPSEPYPFAERHQTEILAAASGALDREHVRLVDGQLVTWYGPRIVTALRHFTALFDNVRGE